MRWLRLIRFDPRSRMTILVDEQTNYAMPRRFGDRPAVAEIARKFLKYWRKRRPKSDRRSSMRMLATMPSGCMLSVASLERRESHCKDDSVGGQYRTKMVDLPKSCGRQWQVESFMSGLKRTTSNALNARLPKAMFADASFRVIAYALRL